MTKIRLFLGVLAIITLFSVEISSGISEAQPSSRLFFNVDGSQLRGEWSQFPRPRYKTMKELGLTDDQWGDIKDLSKNFKEELIKIRQQHRKDILDVLTPDQLDSLKIKINEINKFKREHLKHHRGMHENLHQKYRPWQRQRRDKGVPFLKQIDYVEPEGSLFLAAAPLYNIHNDPATKRAIINKPIADNNRKTSWGKIKNLFE